MIIINEKISYIPASENPLSADIGIINDCGKLWLYDVGSDENRIIELDKSYNVVISHFHQDHTHNLSRIKTDEIFGSKETIRHIRSGNIVTEETVINNVRIFPVPSSHCKGCLGLEVDETYTFIGDAAYCRHKNGLRSYNAQILKEEIMCLKSLKSEFLLVSHYDGFIRRKDDVIHELEAIYKKREQNSSEIFV